MKRQLSFLVVLNLAGGILLLALAVRFFQRGDLSMGVLTGVAAIAMLALAWEHLAKLRRP